MASEADSPPDFDFAAGLAFPLAAGFAVLGGAAAAASFFPSGSLRSNLTWSFLSRRNPCFHPSIRCRACWAASSLAPKSKIKKECAMPCILAGDAPCVKTVRLPKQDVLLKSTLKSTPLVSAHCKGLCFAGKHERSPSQIARSGTQICSHRSPSGVASAERFRAGGNTFRCGFARVLQHGLLPAAPSQYERCPEGQEQLRRCGYARR